MRSFIVKGKAHNIIKALEEALGVKYVKNL